MKRIVLTFGLISGALLSAMMSVTMAIVNKTGEHGLVLGYTTMVLAFLLVYFGIRTYRDNVAGGSVSFGRAFSVGILIALITCVCYVATWEVIYYRFMPDFMDRYADKMIEKARASGATAAQLAAVTQEWRHNAETYKNPLVNIGYTFLEVFPVGLVMTLVSAAILRRRSSSGAALASTGAARAP